MAKYKRKVKRKQNQKTKKSQVKNRNDNVNQVKQNINKTNKIFFKNKETVIEKKERINEFKETTLKERKNKNLLADLKKFNKQNKTNIKLRTDEDILQFRQQLAKQNKKANIHQKNSIYKENYIKALYDVTTEQEFNSIIKTIDKIPPRVFLKAREENDNLDIRFMYVESKRKAMVNGIKRGWEQVFNARREEINKRRRKNYKK